MESGKLHADGQESEESRVTVWANIWDFHELDYAHRRFGRIFICGDGRVIRWESEDK